MKKIFIISVLALTIATCFASADEPAGTRQALQLVKAIYAKNLSLVARLVRKGANVNARHVGLTVLHHAVTTSNLKIIRFLVAKGANVNGKNEHGESVLSFAKKIGNSRVIRYLKSVGAR